MKIYRVTAVLCEGGQLNKNSKYMLLCGVDEELRIVNGIEWFGYVKHGYVTYPFVLQENGTQFFYGDETERTIIGERLIELNEYFTVHSENKEVTFKIISCHPHES